MSKQPRVYCTLFNKKYLARGLALYFSLREHSPAFRLFVFCFDDDTYHFFREKQYSSVIPVSLAEFETPALLAVKQTRTIGEYCWTSTPLIIEHVLDQFQEAECTYLDADLFFFSNPEVLHEEIPEAASVLLTEHRYTPEYDQTETSGKYCVQFITFKDTESGRAVLGWWKDRCLEWCYARFEGGKFGDQKYLDDWLTRFPGVVHDLQHPGGGLAPWNVQQYDFWCDKNSCLIGQPVTGAPEFPVVFYHFHDFEFWPSGGWGHKSNYFLSDEVYHYFYRAYLNRMVLLREEIQSLGNVDFPSSPTALPVILFYRVVLPRISDLPLRRKIRNSIQQLPPNDTLDVHLPPISLEDWIRAGLFLRRSDFEYIHLPKIQAQLQKTQAQLWRRQSISQLFCAADGEYNYSINTSLSAPCSEEWQNFTLQYDLGPWAGHITEFLWIPMLGISCEVQFTEVYWENSIGGKIVTRVDATNGMQDGPVISFLHGHPIIRFPVSSVSGGEFVLQGRWRVIDTWVVSDEVQRCFGELDSLKNSRWHRLGRILKLVD